MVIRVKGHDHDRSFAIALANLEKEETHSVMFHCMSQLGPRPLYCVIILYRLFSLYRIFSYHFIPDHVISNHIMSVCVCMFFYMYIYIYADRLLATKGPVVNSALHVWS